MLLLAYKVLFMWVLNIHTYVHTYIHVIVVTQASVHCLICTHNAQVPEGQCIRIRQCTPACVTDYTLKVVKSLKGIATSVIQTFGNRLAAKMVTCNIRSLYKQCSLPALWVYW